VYDGQAPIKLAVNNLVDDGFEQVGTERLKHEGFKKQAKNIFAVQSEGEAFVPLPVQQPLQQVVILEK
jgi:hypothetical protein